PGGEVERLFDVAGAAGRVGGMAALAAGEVVTVEAGERGLDGAAAVGVHLGGRRAAGSEPGEGDREGHGQDRVLGHHPGLLSFSIVRYTARRARIGSQAGLRTALSWV